MTVDPDIRHPAYEEFGPKWVLMRDAFEGEDEVKAKGEAYLPRPSGMASAPDPEAAYKAYLKRALYPDILASTVRGMAGLVHRKGSSYVLPEALDPQIVDADGERVRDTENSIVERATRDGLTLESLHRRLTREVLTAGRYGLLTELRSEGEQAYLAGYNAESILNWDIDEDYGVSLVVLDESSDVRDLETGRWDYRRRWRILELVDGYYQVRILEKHESGIVEVDLIEPRMRGGERMPFIPFTFVDTNDLTPDPDEIPLVGLARIAGAVYRMDADYRHALYLTSQPTAVAIGVNEDMQPHAIGSSVVWHLPEGGDAKMLEFSGAGVGAQRQAIVDDLERAVQLGARMLSDSTSQAESGEARRLRFANESATLTSIAQNVGAGLEQALRFAAQWVGEDPSSVSVEPNTDFAGQPLSAQDIDALVRGWQQGAFSWGTLWHNLKRGGVVPDDKTEEAEQAEIQTTSPFGGPVPLGED